MLVLSRKLGEKVRIGDRIVVTVLKVQGSTVRLGIEAPAEVRVLRAELPVLTTIQANDSTAPRAAESRRVSTVHASGAGRRAFHRSVRGWYGVRAAAALPGGCRSTRSRGFGASRDRVCPT